MSQNSVKAITVEGEGSLNLRLILFVIVRILLNTAFRMVYPYLGVFQRGLGVDLRTFSLGISARSVSGIAGPFLATVADRYGRRAGMLLGVATFTLGLSLVVIWPSFPTFLLMMILTNLGNFVFLPSMQAYLGDRVPYERRGTVLAITEFSWSFSFILGIPLVGLAIRLYGWQAPFPFLALLGLTAMAALLRLIPAAASSEDKAYSLRHNLGMIFANPRALAGLAMALTCSASNEMVNVTFGVWLEESFQVQIATLAVTALIIGASELGGEGLASLLVDRLGKMSSYRIGITLNTLAVLSLPFLGVSLSGALAGLFFTFLTFEFCIVSIIPLMTEMLPTARATYMAVFIASIFMGRALTDLIALPIFIAGRDAWLTNGILAVAMVAAGINMISFLTSRLVRIESPSTPDATP